MFRKIVHRLPLEGWPWHILAEAYKLKGDYTGAMETYHLALQYISIDYSFHKCLADLYLETSNHQKALEYYDRTNELAPESFLWEYINLRPISSYDATDSQLPINESLREYFLWHSVGVAYKTIGENSKACEIYDTVIHQYHLALKGNSTNLLIEYTGLDPFYGNSDVFNHTQALPATILWCALGEAHRGKGDVKGALGAFTKAKELEPKNQWLQSVVCEMEMKV